MLKQEIRQYMKELKEQLTIADIEAFSKRILNQFMQSKEFKNCSRVFTYVSFNQEVITNDLIITALSQQKKVAVPKITGNEMKFYYINSMEDLHPGILGILEPEALEEAIPDRNNENLIIVPGLAFDKQRNRIGYGRGYYDGFFLKYNTYPLKKIALAYDFQVILELPAEAHDIKVDQIITQSLIIGD